MTFNLLGYVLVKQDDYDNMVRQNNAYQQGVETENAKVGAKMIELQAELDSANSRIRGMEAEYRELLEAHGESMAKLETRHHIDLENLAVNLRNDYLMSSGAAEAALEKRLREEFDETLSERDAELQRSVQQASTLGYDNEQLQIAVCNLNNEVAALKRSESEKWEAAMSSQAEVVKLKAEIEKLTKKPTPRKRGGK